MDCKIGTVSGRDTHRRTSQSSACAAAYATTGTSKLSSRPSLLRGSDSVAAQMTDISQTARVCEECAQGWIGGACEEAAALQRTSSISTPFWKTRTLCCPGQAAPDGTPTAQIRIRLKIAPKVTNAAEPAQLLSLFQPSWAVLPQREPTTSAMPSPPHSCPTATSAAVVPCVRRCEVRGQVAELCAALLQAYCAAKAQHC